jgi:hypothetical protein
MKKLVIVLAIVFQQACTTTTIQPDMIDSSTAKKWECVTTTPSHAGIKFTAVYDQTSNIGYLESRGEKHYTKSNFFSDRTSWNPPEVVVLVHLGNITFYEAGKHTRHIDARCDEL